jgi:hypothetical protein
MVETVFSVLKRKFGESLKARKFPSQIKELKIKLILYNILKIIHSILIHTRSEEFYRASKSPLCGQEREHPYLRAIITIFLMN